MARENTLTIPKTVRYFSQGNPKTAKYVWLVLHGYGQLPEYFIRKFASLSPDEHFVIAPEGMHRFYLEGTQGRVGASWMTKIARTDDIHDNIAYLNALCERLSSEIGTKKKILLGFSQGGATAARFHQLGHWSAEVFVLWGSVFPPDLQLPSQNGAYANSSNFILLGNEDPYYGEEEKTKLLDYLKHEQLNFQYLPYDGGHTVTAEALMELLRLVFKIE